MILLDNENSAKHWEFIDVQDRVVLDLGCGRWNKVEKVENSWLTTPEHFIKHGAKKVIAVDTDPEEISWFNQQFPGNENMIFLLQNINSANDILNLYNTYNPDCVKIDIETGERFLLELSETDFCNIKEYYIETHGYNLYQLLLSKLIQYKYKIIEQIDLTHTNGYCKVIFAQQL